MEWSKLIKEKKYYIPIILSVVMFIGITFNGIRFRNISADTVEVDLENYAYKEITGFHSPYIISSDPNEFIIDKLVDLSDTDPKVVEEAMVASGYDGDEFGQPMKENERGMLYQTDEDNGISDVGNGLFDFVFITDELWDSDKAVEKDLDYSPIQELTQSLKENAGKLIEGTFSWNYKNNDNKADFLAYRVGEYIYDSRIVSTDLLYNRIHEKVVNNKISIEVEYDITDVKTYIHPSIGGTTMECPIILKITENGNTQVFSMDYIASMSFRTPSPRDVWVLWASSNEGLRVVNQDYLRNIERID